eukprot:CAMPEP_0178374186 /NCGR_PEP_ID=MMETSP0689_2-20121128/2247_1 /TAXON_ID=160604 /ORGANISM="Amphidinium massartii, Strain CS-259" /LENGTH=39 /DNA_ID= /DNA_START= /DNA_END= /DNA_ORIENTATION=
MVLGRSLQHLLAAALDELPIGLYDAGLLHTIGFSQGLSV